MKRMALKCFIIIGVIVFTFHLPANASETRINGFVSQGYLKTNKNNFHTNTVDGSFEFNEMGLNFSNSLSNNLFLGIQFFARDLGKLGNDEITIDWAYADYIFSNMFGLRAGKIKVPYGFYNESRDADMLRTSVFLPTSIYSEPWRDSTLAMKGVGIYGTFFNNLSYQLQYGGKDLSLDSGIIKQYQGLIPAEHLSFTTKDFSILSLQLSEIITGLRLGFGYYIWNFSKELDFGEGMGVIPSEGDIHTWIAGLEYIWYRLTFATEYAIFKFDAPINFSPNKLDVKADTEFYYFNLSYQFTDFFSAGVSYSATYANRDDHDGKKFAEEYGLLGIPAHSAFSKDTCVSLRFDINANWVFKVEGHYFEGSGAAYILDNKDESGNIDLEKYWMLFAAKLMFVF